MVKMTAKQQRFCDEYLIDLNATQAAIRAGYSKKTARMIGNENLSKPYIAEYIKKRMDEKESELIADQDEVLKYLSAVMRGTEASEQVMVDSLGEVQKIAVKVQSNQIKAAELLGKAHSIFTDKIEQQIDMELKISIDYGDQNDNNSKKEKKV